MARWIWLVAVCAWLGGCSDFYQSDFTHITSAKLKSEGMSEDTKSLLEREIQAMRKSQIMQDDHTRVVGIARYINDIDSSRENEGAFFADEVFYVELYDKTDEIRASKLRARLSNGFKNVEASSIERISAKKLGILKPDVAYNEVYRLRFPHMGARGRDSWKLQVELKGVGVLSFDYGYAKRKSNLTQ